MDNHLDNLIRNGKACGLTVTPGAFELWPRSPIERPHEIHAANEFEIDYSTPEERGDSQSYPVAFIPTVRGMGEGYRPYRYFPTGD